jgi:protein-disulfide isomerase
LIRRELFLGGAAIAVGCASQFALRRDGPNLAGALRTDAGRITFDARCPQKGVIDPRCVLVAWSDFECPACVQLAGDIDELLAEKLAIRLVLKHYPLAMHRDARRYAVVSQSVWLALGAEAFWRVHDALLRAGPTPDATGDWLGRLGIDTAKVRPLGPQAERDVEDHMEQARALGLKATPLLIVGDKVIPGRAPYEALRDLVLATIG